MVRNNLFIIFLTPVVWLSGRSPLCKFPSCNAWNETFFLPFVLYIAVNILSQDILHPPLCTCQNLRRMWGSNSNATRALSGGWCNNVTSFFSPLFLCFIFLSFFCTMSVELCTYCWSSYGRGGFVDAIVSAVKNDPVHSPLAVLISCNSKSEKLKNKKKLRKKIMDK